MSIRAAVRNITIAAILCFVTVLALLVAQEGKAKRQKLVAAVTAPAGVKLLRKDASFLAATFKPELEDDLTLHATTSNSSFAIRHHDADPSTAKPFIISVNSATIHGVKHVNIMQFMEHTFIQLESVNGKLVRLQVPADEDWKSFADETTIKMMYEEDMRILEQVKASNVQFGSSWREDMLAQHKDSLKATIDMMHTMGTYHKITGTEFPHTLGLWSLALQLSKMLEYDPFASAQSHPTHNTTHRQLWGSGTSKSCASKTCSVNYRCQDVPSNHCLGMCGPGCTCWKSICNNCCYNYFCYKHDMCCSGQGKISDGACWNVVYHLGSISCRKAYNYNCRALWGDGSGGGHH